MLVLSKPFILSTVCAWLCAFCSVACGQSQTTVPQTSKSQIKQANQRHLRELLANQPDFVADEILFSAEKRGSLGFASGHRLVFKRAKKDEYYRLDTGVVIVYTDAGNRSFKYDARRKKLELDTEPDAKEDWYEGANNPSFFSKKQGVKFEVVGTEKIQEHECTKIRATKEGAVVKNGETEEVYFYVAKDLKNLVLATEILLPNRRTSYVLTNISFDVPATLFKHVVVKTTNS